MPSASGTNWSLAARVTLLFALLAALIVLGLLSAVWYQAKAQAEDDQRAYLTRLARVAARSLDTDMSARFEDVAFVAGLAELRSAPAQEQRQLLERLQRRHPEFAWLGLADPQGRVRAATGGLLEGQDVQTQPWFRRGLTGAALGDVHAAELLAEFLPGAHNEPLRLVDISVPVLDEDGRLRGVLGAHLSWSWLARVELSVHELAPAERPVEVLILDRRGRVLHGEAASPVARPESTPNTGEAEGREHVTNHVVQARGFLSSLSLAQGQDAYPGLGWQVLVRQQSGTVLVPIAHRQRQVLGWGAASVALLSLLAWWGARWATDPLQRLQHSVAGMLDDPAPVGVNEVRGYREVEQLSASLAGLAARLRAREEEQKRWRARLEQRLSEEHAQLQQTNEELETFSYSVSHDLRAPLRHVQGFVGMVRRSMAERLDDKSARYLTVIEGSASRMDALIDALLDYSRTSRRPMHPVSVDLNMLIEQAQTNLEPLLVGRPVDWNISPLPVVVGDSFLLQRALTNLLSNALKFTSTRENARIAVWADEHPDEWMVQVRDNGVGFDPRFAEKLFGVFQRLHRQEEFEGTGIGLALVRRIVLRHGGQVWADARPNQGATFAFTLPKRSLTAEERTQEDEIGVP
ncbi:sensor histidine kinase [Deinococcus peraridilitoris]|uniref:histidine kinase n=1 Tax=Deinococcus peraridilitoris (strain DSM 19664 / LMG 22246 / CIP 109416 / KR-200) TaxID=937777 RepID=K9ZY62_DEIPD|nr:sensor histidine kinase [Deinococcus peraridilitoris]AFZ66119.1 bacteriophytochrome (light-regulated signal transduction histidine kinase) [Deinococcus peraridilitoris DSM 19664]